MKQVLIGLCGRAGCGKDTAARYLVSKHGYEHYALARPLKLGLSAMLDIAPGKLEDRTFKEEQIPWLGKSPRQMLQTLGTEWGRQCVHPDIWVQLMLHRWDSVRKLNIPGMTVSDVRFDNEAESIRRHGGKIVKLIRPEATDVAPHSSEAGISLELVNYTIINSGTIHDLHGSLDRMMAEILE